MTNQPMSSPSPENPGDRRIFDPRDFMSVQRAGGWRQWRVRANDAALNGLRSAGEFCARPWPKRSLIAAAVAALIAGAAIAYDHWTVKPPPNFAVAQLDDVLDYTLLTEDFNKLPLQQRLDLIGQLVARLKGASANDSAMVAAFAAGIMGPARAQLQRNAERLAVDLWDSYAKDYAQVKPEDQSAFLDQSVIEFSKTLEGLAGVDSGLEDGERLDRAKAQAKRDQERAAQNAGPLSSARAGRLFSFMEQQSEQVPDVRQRSRMARFSRDVTRHLRGQDVSTGKPKGGG